MLNLVRFWILLSTLLVGGGWILSALHQLNRTGYAMVLSALTLVVFVWWKKSRSLSVENFRRLHRKFSKRFRRRAPQLFLLIAALSLLSGALYPALNYDANAYRLPRVMHWLWAGHWHWIHTFDSRMNIAACGMEWLSAPLILFSHSDRLLFLINWISYLMLPGLIFSVFTRLQVRPRVAWWWAWLLSSGWCFALQAGSVANDSFAAIYILAAVDLALRAHEKNSKTDLWLSLLAAALATGAKQTNIPLAVLWFLAAWPARSLFWKNPLRTSVVAVFALLVSIVPISVLNYRHCGTWMPLNSTGVATLGQFHLNPFWGVIGNALCIPVQNLLPPFYELLPPFYSYWVPLWNEWMRGFLHTSFGAHFSSFENFGYLSGVYYHGISEGNAGLGLGICVVIFAALREMRRLKKSFAMETATRSGLQLRLLRIAPWGLLLLFMAKVGTFENARQIAPYYAFLFPAWLVKAALADVVRQRRWQKLGLFFMAVTAALVAASGDRPLFPARTILNPLREKFPDGEIVSGESARYLESFYQITQARRDFVKQALPKDETVIGYYAEICDVDETGIWLPFGQHRVECISPDDPPERLRTLGIRFVIINGAAVHKTHGNIQNWLKQYDAVHVDDFTFPRPELKTVILPDLYLVRLK
jgi:hypothetical protein